jgi:hypothetical protein
MKRGLVAAMAVGLALVSSVAWAQQEHCWTMAPFVDELRVTLDQHDPALGFYGVMVTWTGAGVYQLQGGGTAQVIQISRPNSRGRWNIVEGQARINMSFQTHNNTGFFGDNRQGNFHASIGVYSFTGHWHFTFVGDNGVFTNRGQLVPKTCGGSQAGETMAELQMQAMSGPFLAGQ